MTFILLINYITSFGTGGVIEACPPSESITTLTADMLIEPTGTVNLLACGDQIHAESPFFCWGVSVPQSSIEPSVLNDACHRIGDACKARGIVGYLRIDFVTFIHPKTVICFYLSKDGNFLFFFYLHILDLT